VKILVTPTSFTRDKQSPAKDLLESCAAEIRYNPLGMPLTAGDLIPLLAGIDGYIAGLDYITAEVIAAAPSSLKVISRYGAGYDRVDITAAAKKGVVVTNTPGVNSQSVADLAFGLMLAAARKIPALDRRIRAGEWSRISGVELYQKTLGIIGLGEIGKAVANRAQGFAMNILACDPYLDKSYARSKQIREVSFEELITNSDIITLHIPLNEQTRIIIDERAISKLKPGAIIINTSRGGLIDEEAAYRGLISGQLGGMGVDVFETEPPAGSPLLTLDNVVATPHAGAHTAEAINNMGLLAVQNLIDVLSGRECKYVINPGAIGI
jgi:D-3-phosphoglycerate dehydrogenase